MSKDGAALPGTMIVVVGPSGAGKDSVIGFASDRLRASPGIALVRRVITRAADAGGEDHEPVSQAEFEARRAAGNFAVSWSAHGLHYGIPADTLATVEAGTTLIANGSRAALAAFRSTFPRIAVVNIVAAPEIVARRLAERGRESEAEIRRRLDRQAPEVDTDPCVITIDNSGALEDAGERFADLVLRLTRRTW